MAINIKTTLGNSTNGIKVLVYGHAGSGKTTLIKTLPHPIILSAEAGLLSISDADIPFIEIKSIDELREAYEYIANSGGEYQSVALDSVSEIAEVVLNAEKKNTKDPRQAYGALQEQMTDIIRAFRDLPGSTCCSPRSARSRRMSRAVCCTRPPCPATSWVRACRTFSTWCSPCERKRTRPATPCAP